MDNLRQLADAELDGVTGGLNELGAFAQATHELGQALQDFHTFVQGKEFGQTVSSIAQTSV